MPDHLRRRGFDMSPILKNFTCPYSTMPLNIRPLRAILSCSKLKILLQHHTVIISRDAGEPSLLITHGIFCDFRDTHAHTFISNPYLYAHHGGLSYIRAIVASWIHMASPGGDEVAYFLEPSGFFYKMALFFPKYRLCVTFSNFRGYVSEASSMDYPTLAGACNWNLCSSARWAHAREHDASRCHP